MIASKFDVLVQLFKQPSTKAGLLMLAGAAGLNFAPESYDVVINAFLGLVGLYEMVRKEHLLD